MSEWLLEVRTCLKSTWELIEQFLNFLVSWDSDLFGDLRRLKQAESYKQKATVLCWWMSKQEKEAWGFAAAAFSSRKMSNQMSTGAFDLFSGVREGIAEGIRGAPAPPRRPGLRSEC